MNLPDASRNLTPAEHALALVDVVADYFADGRTGPARAALEGLRRVLAGLSGARSDHLGTGRDVVKVRR